MSALPWTGEHFELLPSASHPAYPWPAVVLGLGLVLGPAYWVGNQAIVQRSFGMKSEADARASYVFAAVIKLSSQCCSCSPGCWRSRSTPTSWARPARAGTPTGCCR